MSETVTPDKIDQLHAQMDARLIHGDADVSPLDNGAAPPDTDIPNDVPQNGHHDLPSEDDGDAQTESGDSIPPPPSETVTPTTESDPAPHPQVPTWMSNIGLKLLLIGCLMIGFDLALLGTMFGAAFHELTRHVAVLTTLCDLVQGDGLLCADPWGAWPVQSIMSSLLAFCGTLGLVGIMFIAWRKDVWSDLSGVFKDCKTAPVAILCTLCLALILSLEYYGWNSLIYEITRHRVHNPDGMHPLPRRDRGHGFNLQAQGRNRLRLSPRLFQDLCSKGKIPCVVLL